MGLPPSPAPPHSQPILLGVRLRGSALLGAVGAALQVRPGLQVPQHQVVSHVLLGLPQQLLEEPQAGQADLGTASAVTPRRCHPLTHPAGPGELTSSHRWSQRSMSCARRGWGVSPGVSGCRWGPSRKRTRRWSRAGARSCLTVTVSTAVAPSTASSDLPRGTGGVVQGKRGNPPAPGTKGGS